MTTERRPLSLMLDTEALKLNDEDKKKHPSELVTTIIKNVVLNYAQGRRGISGEDRKLFYKMSDVFDQAVKDKAESVQLEDNIAGFIRRVFREATLTPDPFLRQIEKAVEDLRSGT